MFSTRTQAKDAYEAADAERSVAEARTAASKRYRGRADDLRLIASLTEICWAAAEALAAFDAAARAEYDADGVAPLPRGSMLHTNAHTPAEAERAARATHRAAAKQRSSERAYARWEAEEAAALATHDARKGDTLVPLFPDAPFAGNEATARAETLARLDAAAYG